MPPLNKGVLFSPIRNWSNGESKVLLKFDGEGRVKKRRQFVLEEVVNWHKISAFGEERADTLKNAYRKVQMLKREGDTNRSCNYDITELEREGRKEKETIKVVDKDSMRRTIEILNVGIAIQDLASSKKVKGLDVLYLTKKKGDKTLESVIMRMRDNTRAAIEVGEFI